MNYETDRFWDKTLHIQTTSREKEQGAKFMPYEPTPYSVLARLADSGLIAPNDHVLDYGCGKGRVAFFLAARIGCHVTGIDRSEKLITIAEENRAAFSQPELVHFLSESAEKYRPEKENVFYFFNPFSESVFDIAIRRILKHAAESGHGRLLLYYPSDPFLIRLAAEPSLRLHKEIDCRDLFSGDDTKERILAFDYHFMQVRE